MKPRIIIITMGFSRVVEKITDIHNIAGIIECTDKRSINEQHILIYTAKKIYSCFKKKNRSLQRFAKDKRIPYYNMDNGSDIRLEFWIKTKHPDIIVIYTMNQLLRRNIFDIPKYKTMNLHPSLLPKYRGPRPLFWQYYNEEKKGGVTLHYIDDGEDTGNIIYQEEYDIPLGIKMPELLDLVVGEIGVKLIFKALENIEELSSVVQEKESPTKKARSIKNDEHKDLIDWKNWKIERVWHVLRGSEHWLKAFELPGWINKGQRWTVENYEKCNVENYNSGQVYKIKNKYFVCCKEGKIYLNVSFNLKCFILNIFHK